MNSMNSKDILIAYINTLSDKDCKNIYLLLKEIEGNKGKYELYNSKGEKDSAGLVKLTPKQYHVLYEKWGPEKIAFCFETLTNYLKSNKKVKASHYTLLNGWVETLYLSKNKKHRRKVLPIRFEDVKTKAQARLYVANVPETMRSDDVYVGYLVNKWGVDILETGG